VPIIPEYERAAPASQNPAIDRIESDSQPPNSLHCNLAVYPQTKVAARILTPSRIRLDTLESNLDHTASIAGGQIQKANDTR
jgi:hypothetical protein